MFNKRMTAQLIFAGGINNDGDNQGITIQSYRNAVATTGDAMQLEIIFDSIGGSVAGKNDIIREMKNDHRLKIGVLMGEACSAAFSIWMACDLRFVHSSCVGMIHEARYAPDTELTSNAEQLLRYTNEDIVNHIYERLHLSDDHIENRLTRDDIEDLVHQETWFDSSDLIRLGFAIGYVDETKYIVTKPTNRSLLGVKRPWNRPAIGAKQRRMNADFDRFMNERKVRQAKFKAMEPSLAPPKNPKPPKPKQPVKFPIAPNRPERKSVPKESDGNPHRQQRTFAGGPEPDWDALGLPHPPKGCFATMTGLANYLNERLPLIESGAEPNCRDYFYASQYRRLSHVLNAMKK